MKRGLLVYVPLSLLCIVLDALVVRYLSIAGIVPDILMVWTVYIAIREGQAASTTAGFLLGATSGFLTSGVPGLLALTKTVAGFLAGYFHNENKIAITLGGYQLIVIVALCSFVHNILYFLIFLQGSDHGWFDAVITYAVPSTLYTSAIAALPMFVFARKYLS
jgi:rod shape-determining protein MreD